MGQSTDTDKGKQETVPSPTLILYFSMNLLAFPDMKGESSIRRLRWWVKYSDAPVIFLYLVVDRYLYFLKIFIVLE